MEIISKNWKEENAAKESLIAPVSNLKADTLTEKTGKKNPELNGSSIKYLHFQRLQQQLKFLPPKHLNASVETDDLMPRSQINQSLLTPNEVVESVKAMTSGPDSFKEILLTNFAYDIDGLIEVCQLLRDEYLLQHQKVVDLHNQVKFFKSLAKKNKK